MEGGKEKNLFFIDHLVAVCLFLYLFQPFASFFFQLFLPSSSSSSSFEEKRLNTLCVCV